MEDLTILMQICCTIVLLILSHEENFACLKILTCLFMINLVRSPELICCLYFFRQHPTFVHDLGLSHLVSKVWKPVPEKWLHMQSDRTRYRSSFKKL